MVIEILKPEFFDIFGALAFIFIIVVSIHAIRTDKPLPKAKAIVLLIIGMIGFLIDITIVYLHYLK